MIHNIDFALNSFDFKSLMITCGIYHYNALLRSKDSFDVNDKFDDCSSSNTNLAPLALELETQY